MSKDTNCYRSRFFIKSFFIIPIILCSIFSSHAQNQNSLRVHIEGVNIFYPGIELGYEIPFLTNTKTTKKEKIRLKQLLVAPTLEFYNQKINHAGVSIGADIIAKHIGHNGFEFLFFANGGLLQTILSGDVYEQNEDGSFSSSKIKGNRHFQWKAGFGLGKHLMKVSDRPLSFNMRLGVRQQNLPGSWIVFTGSAGVNYYFSKKNEE